MKAKFDVVKAMRRIVREQRLQDLKDGRKNRAATYRSSKDYRRKPKHKETYRD